MEDEFPPRMGDRLDAAIALAHKIRRYGGIFVVLIHPDILDHKFDFQVGFVDALRDHAWFGSLRQFGDWWSARDRIKIDVKSKTSTHRVVLDVPEAISGLVLSVPASWRLSTIIPEDIQAIQKGRNIVLDNAQGKIKLVF